MSHRYILASVLAVLVTSVQSAAAAETDAPAQPSSVLPGAENRARAEDSDAATITESGEVRSVNADREAEVQDAFAEIARLRQRRIDDLRALAAESDGQALPEVQLVLAETLVRSAEALRRPGASSAIHAGRERPDTLVLEAIDLLGEVWLSGADAQARDRAGLSLAHLVELRGDTDAALRLLGELEAVSDDVHVVALAAERRALLLEGRADPRAQSETLDAYERALRERPTPSNRLGAARSAAQIGDTARALGHYGVLLRLTPPPDNEHALSARRQAGQAIGSILARTLGPEIGIASVEALGAPGSRVWYPFGEGLRARGEHAGARIALSRAVVVDPTLRGRLLARCAAAEVGLATGDRAFVVEHIAELSTVLEGGEAIAGSTAARVEQVIRLTVSQIHVEPRDAWPESFVERVISTYLHTFADAEAAAMVRLVRGHRRVDGDPDCSTRQLAADDMIHAFRHAPRLAPRVQLDAGVAAVMVLAGCRPAEDGIDGRPRPTPVDDTLLSLAADVLEAGPALHDTGAIHLVIGRAKLVDGRDDVGARDHIERALSIEGAHLDEAALAQVSAWSASGDELQAEEHALRLLDDARLSPDVHRLLRIASVDAALAHADKVTGRARADRLARLVDRHPTSPRAIDALLDAAMLYRADAAGTEAHACLERARALEAKAGEAGPGHIALAALLDAQGRFANAAEVYAAIVDRWTLARPPQVDDAAVLRMSARAALRWRALGRWTDAAVVGMNDRAARSVAQIEAAERRLAQGDVAGARTLASSLDLSTRPVRRRATVLIDCPTAEIAELFARASSRPALSASVSHCVVARLERQLDAALPDDPKARTRVIMDQQRQAGPILTALFELGDPLSMARARLVVAEWLGAAADSLSRWTGDTSGGRLEQARRLHRKAWSVWSSVAPQAYRLGIDGILSRRLGRVATHLAEITLDAGDDDLSLEGQGPHGSDVREEAP